MRGEWVLEGTSLSHSASQDRYLSPDLLQPYRVKAEAINHAQRRVQTVAFSEFIEDDVKKLLGCFIMCGRIIKTRLSHQEESTVRNRVCVQEMTLQLNLKPSLYRHIKNHTRTDRMNKQAQGIRILQLGAHSPAKEGLGCSLSLRFEMMACQLKNHLNAR